MSQIVHADRHDAQGLIGEFVLGLAAMIEYGLVGIEDAIR